MSMEVDRIYVEGGDDKHVIAHLLARHSIALDPESGPVVIVDQGNDARVLEIVQTAIKGSVGRSVGFVLDIDDRLEDRWRSLKNKIETFGITLPAECPQEGLVANVPDLMCEVGVWLMPDNVALNGRLESLLETLVPAGSPIWLHAGESTQKAIELGSVIKDQDRLKARLHAYLAWQTEPGLPFGTAIKARYFSHDSPEAVAFVKWFKKLFGL